MWKYFYLIHIQYLGYRFHGWAKQPKVKTVHQMIDKTLSFVFTDEKHKTLGSSRTDAMVSANDMAFEMFLQKPIDTKEFLVDFNKNSPSDIRAISIEEVSSEFNIIQSPKHKEYVYLFAHGAKNHPFSAPFMHSFAEKLDIELMKEGALLFEGEHNFKRYCKKPKENATFVRTIDYSRIEKNTIMNASFFPEESWAFHIHSKGFLRNQVRLMMGQLYQLGKGAITIDEFQRSFTDELTPHFDYIAPASALMLQKTHFDLK